MDKELIKKKIRLLGIKKSHVANQIGCSSSELSHYLHDRRPLKPESLEKLRVYLG